MIGFVVFTQEHSNNFGVFETMFGQGHLYRVSDPDAQDFIALLSTHVKNFNRHTWKQEKKYQILFQGSYYEGTITSISGKLSSIYTCNYIRLTVFIILLYF